jgi:hypothetical protein
VVELTGTPTVDRIATLVAVAPAVIVIPPEALVVVTEYSEVTFHDVEPTN